MVLIILQARVENILPFTRMEAQIAVMNHFYIGRPSDPVSGAIELNIVLKNTQCIMLIGPLLDDGLKFLEKKYF